MSSRVCPDSVPVEIGVYRVLDVLAHGSTGDVFLAADPAGSQVAIKRLPDDAESHQRQRFEREIRTMARLDHPAIVRVLETFRDGAGHYLVMEHIEGESLAALIRRTGPLTFRRVSELGAAVAGGLAAAHRLGILHRDLKAENVMVTPDGGIKILDFGLAKEVDGELSGDDSLTQTGMILGTWRVMSPEQAGGQPMDERSDLFSLGVLLYEMVSAYSPFRGENAFATLRNILTRQPKPVSALRADVPPLLATLIERLLCKEADQRPATAVAVAQELERLAADRRDRCSPSVLPHPAALEL